MKNQLIFIGSLILTLSGYLAIGHYHGKEMHKLGAVFGCRQAVIMLGTYIPKESIGVAWDSCDQVDSE